MFYILLAIGIFVLATVILYFTCFNKKKQEFFVKKGIQNIEFDEAFRGMSRQEQITRNKCPKFTKTGFSIQTLPKELSHRLKQVWNDKKHIKKLEKVPHKFIHGTKTSRKEILNLLDLSKHDPGLKRDLEQYVKQQLEKWIGKSNLIHTATYGIREYRRGAVLKVHCDKYDTHVLSAIIHITHDQEKAWPLTVWDHDNKKHDVYLDDDVNLVLYESVALMHGRPYPLKGNSYVNIFLHFTLPNWKESMDKLL